MSHKGKWSGRLAYFYYISGSAYYLSHWFLTFGGASFLAGSISFYYGVPLLGAILLILSLFAIVFGISFLRKMANARYRSHNPGLHVESIKIDYKVIDDQNCDYTRHVKVKSLFPVEHYQALFNWTGQGDAIAIGLDGVDHTKILKHLGTVDDICRVHFGQPLAKGKIYNFAYKLELREATKPIRPFLGYTVDVRLEKLILRVQLPTNRKYNQYKRQMFISLKDNLHLWEEIVPIEDHQYNLEWIIPHAGRYYYRLSW